ncbi:hypothetical protein ACQ4N7_10160 [Nodosilinea sp. AN01ver1]
MGLLVQVSQVQMGQDVTTHLERSGWANRGGKAGRPNAGERLFNSDRPST